MCLRVDDDKNRDLYLLVKHNKMNKQTRQALCKLYWYGYAR